MSTSFPGLSSSNCSSNSQSQRHVATFGGKLLKSSYPYSLDITRDSLSPSKQQRITEFPSPASIKSTSDFVISSETDDRQEEEMVCTQTTLTLRNRNVNFQHGTSRRLAFKLYVHVQMLSEHMRLETRQTASFESIPKTCKAFAPPTSKVTLIYFPSSKKQFKKEH